MPVTKCEPETTRKASRKSAKTQETVLSALLAQTEEVSVPLASLIKSPLNVRTVPYSAESVSELAESIKGVGLLQNLVVHTLPGDRYGVAAGGRRLAAYTVRRWRWRTTPRVRCRCLKLPVSRDGAVNRMCGLSAI